MLLGVRCFFLGWGHVIDMPNAVSFLFPNLLPIRRIAGWFFQWFQYRWGHISHMHLDRLWCLVRGHHIFTVFIAPPSGRTIAMRTYLDLTFIYNIIIYIICSCLRQHYNRGHWARPGTSRTLSAVTPIFVVYSYERFAFILAPEVEDNERPLGWAAYPFFYSLYIGRWIWYVVWSHRCFFLTYLKPRWRCT